MHYRTDSYNRLRNEIDSQLSNPGWSYAPQWRNRVGVPRMTAESALLEASALIRSINMGTFRNDPEGRERVLEASEAVSEAAQTVVRENWRRFRKEVPEHGE